MAYLSGLSGNGRINTEETIPILSIPPNVKLPPWMPRAPQELLGHPKIRLFITHGGLNCLNSKQEAVYHDVPFIVMPVFADRPINAQKAHD